MEPTVSARTSVQHRCRLTAALLFLVVGLGLPAARAQDAVLKAEELIRAQSIPLSRLVSFEQQYPDEELDYTAWLVLRALDKNPSWNPRNRSWNVYRINIRYGLEQSLRRRWQTAGGTIRSLSDNPDTSLAKFYSNTLSSAELDEALNFCRSEAGRKYTQYLREFRRAYYRGALEFDRIAIDPDLGGPGEPDTARRKAWLQKKGVSLSPPPEGYEFHVKSGQELFPRADPANLVFALIAGAPPGSEAYQRLDQTMPQAERDTVARYLASVPHQRERQARWAWSEAIAKSGGVIPLLIGDLRGMVEVLSEWRRARVQPNALPRSIVELAPESIKVPDEYPLLSLEDPATPVAVRACLPLVPEASIASLTRDRDGKSYRDFRAVISRPGENNQFVTRREYGACIPLTAPGYPIPAVNSFLSTIRFPGMTEEDSRRWYRSIAQDIAVNGASESLVVMPGGNAYEVAFAVDIKSPTNLLYQRHLLPARTYDPKRYRTVINTSSTTIAVTGTTGPDGVTRTEKSLITTPDDVRRALDRLKPPPGT